MTLPRLSVATKKFFRRGHRLLRQSLPRAAAAGLRIVLLEEKEGIDSLRRGFPQFARL